MVAPELADQVLRVCPSRTMDDGWWPPAHGDIKGLEGWEFLPAGDAFVTRQVKRQGPYWVVLRARRGYTETLGLLAPAASVQAARSLAAESKAGEKWRGPAPGNAVKHRSTHIDSSSPRRYYVS